MELADGVAIIVGRLLHRRLPGRLLHVMASVLFLLYGLWLLFDNALGWRWVAVAATTTVAVSDIAAAVVAFVRSRRVHGDEAELLKSSPDSTIGQAGYRRSTD